MGSNFHTAVSDLQKSRCISDVINNLGNLFCYYMVDGLQPKYTMSINDTKKMSWTCPYCWLQEMNLTEGYFKHFVCQEAM